MSKFKVGRRAFSTVDGWVTVISTSHTDPYSTKVKNGDGSFSLYTRDGKYHKDSKYPALFDSPQEASEYFAKIKTKRKIKIERWINIYSDGNVTIHSLKSAAENSPLLESLELVAREHFCKEYEVDS